MIIYKLIHPLYISNGKQYKVMYILLISAIVNIILNFIIIPIKGAIGAGIASVFSYSICGIIFWYYFKKDYSFNVKDIIKKYILSLNDL